MSYRKVPIIVLITVLIDFLIVIANATLDSQCNLESVFSSKLVSVEENAQNSRVILGGTDRPVLMGPIFDDEPDGAFVAVFDFFMTYKGSQFMDNRYLEDSDFRNSRIVNITFTSRPLIDCQIAQVPTKYIIFCDVVDNELVAHSVVKWDHETDQRVWMAVGWTKWSEWSTCSVSCGKGIQQRLRYCTIEKCEGYNVEQRHCNLFGCVTVVNPLATNYSKFFHPSRERWQQVPSRPSAWRLVPNTYIWVPSSQLFGNGTNGAFPKEFTLFITMRTQNSSTGTIFSLRSRRREDSYLSLELSGSDLKLIHVGSNGTEAVRISTPLEDGNWHQITISLRDNSVVDSYIDCLWSTTDYLRVDSFDIPEDSDIIIGYLFSGDIEQLAITSDLSLSDLQCDDTWTPIREDSLMYLKEKKLGSAEKHGLKNDEGFEKDFEGLPNEI
ncbi:uncharacterized protein [Onthophagus taurus]|uniref:uncharacterized protein isoform X1 n=1 Tax=Onthophagus taurus TaxID=166361 RepID=UPI0039BDB992